ncbi:hypothetical protein [Paenibacillus brasilensis]|uniref:Uncharacterized protein n=1 Tax=Paenibacillus brasilensis TaxID=128574 RepID=A0ABU0KX75_9BACL|nr:hypothetical protein [Paenibacillus brasilensis]MDQ0494041.1 hypothetical protein [Paenibacillus brasilensis]
MKTPKHSNYMVCYDKTGEKRYGLYKYCDCADCKNRMLKREPVNWVSATTKEISKVDDVAEFLKKWTCDTEGRYVGVVFLKF